MFHESDSYANGTMHKDTKTSIRANNRRLEQITSQILAVRCIANADLQKDFVYESFSSNIMQIYHDTNVNIQDMFHILDYDAYTENETYENANHSTSEILTASTMLQDILGSLAHNISNYEGTDAI